MKRTTSVLRFTAVGLLLAATACGAPRRKTMTDRSEGFKDDNVLSIALNKSPSGSSTFDFCPTPAADAILNLTNAAWLSYLSANEYSHLHYLSAALDDLGFQTPDGSGFDWAECAVDLRLLRGFEQKNAEALKKAHKEGPEALKTYLEPNAAADATDGWGACAKRWFAESGYIGENYPAPSFEKYLIQTAHAGHYLQFFSGGEFVLEGKAFVEGSTQVFFARHKTLPVLIISFRGTEPNKWHDVAADGKAWKVKLSKKGWTDDWGSVHTGFYSAFDSIGSVLRDKLNEYEASGLGIWITGHSLGGGLATLMAAEILRRKKSGDDFDLRGVYTFGSPRVGNNAFYDKFMGASAAAKTRVVRFRNGDDMVTGIPGSMLEYKHVGTLAHLGEDSLEFPEANPDYSGVGSVGDHNITGWDKEGREASGYYRRIKKLLESDLGKSEINACE